MTKKQIKAISVLAVTSVMLGITINPNAMHIMEGYLSPKYSIAWGIICIPFLAVGFLSLKKKLQDNPKNMTLLALAGAFIFVISSLKIPSVTGSCSHMTGTGLGAILFGPTIVSILGLIVLLFQAILLAHGGITTLGANIFSMAIAGPFLTYGIFKLCERMKINRWAAVVIAACLGDIFTYVITSLQLAIAYPSAEGGVVASAVKFLGVFAPTQLPLAIMEGILTLLIVIALETYAIPELKNLGFWKSAKN